MVRSLNVVLIALTVLTSFALYRVKYEAQNYEATISGLERDIAEEREAIRVLQAEWSYLNEPERLQTLASRYLELQPTAAHQIVTLDELPMRAQDPDLMDNSLPMGGYAGLLPRANPGAVAGVN